MLDRTDHNHLARLNAARLSASAIADRYIPAADRAVTPADNTPPPDDETPAEVHGKPRDRIADAKEAQAEINGFLTEHPVIENQVQAKAAGGAIERTRIALNELESERKAKADPLYAQWNGINDTYRVVRTPLQKVLDECKRRLTAFTTAEENKRRAEAERLRLEAEALANEANAKIETANDAIAAADVGECIDAGGAIADAEDAMNAADKSDRAAARAERQQTVRIGSTMGGRALSMRSVEVLSVTDAAAALRAMGLTEKITEALLSSARDFKKAHGEWPLGITTTTERRI